MSETLTAGLVAIGGVIVGALLTMIDTAVRDRRARGVARYEAAQRAAERIMDLRVQMDKARLSVWELQRRGLVDESIRAAAFATFRDTVPTLLAAIRLAQMLPLNAEAIGCLKEVDAAVSHLPEKEETFHEFGEERARFDHAFNGFLEAVGRMAR
jgi:hypothetical protein